MADLIERSKIMNFKEAINSGKKVRSEYWSKDTNLDTSIFTDVMEQWMIDLLAKSATPITWKEILGNWYYFD